VSRGALVTGGASGIGAACAERLAAAGYEVTSFDIGQPPATNSAIRYEQVDVSDSAAVTAAVRAAEERGPVAVVVHAAGIRGGQETVTAIERSNARAGLVPDKARSVTIRAFELIDDAALRRMFEVHLFGCFALMRAALPAMLERRAGSIVNISSVCGIVGCDATPHYSSAKAAMIGLTRSIARDVSRNGVRLNVVAPGYVWTPMTRQMESVRENELLAQVPMGRFAKPDEIAAVVAFLAGDDSSYLTGQVLSPNGGMVMQ
jgi:3-oxoacyl-[acyl-carrier protein] reductase